MPFTPAEPLSLVIFILIVLVVAGAFVAGVYFSKLHSSHAKRRKTLIRAVAGVIAWNAFFVAFSATGLLLTQPFPSIPIFFALVLTGAIALGLSRTGLQIASGISLSSLVLFQGFRFPLELVLHSWSKHGTIPETMTWTGQNFDILSGFVAIALAPFVIKFRSLAWAMNFVGVALLLNVMRVAIFSSPLPFAWAVEPPLALLAHFPYLLIAPTCIAGALAGHIILTRALLIRRGIS
jgi:hypothetical protein